MNAVFQEMGPCPCEHPRCDVIGTKLTRKGFLVGCKSPQAMGSRNKKKGRASEARGWKQLGGEGPTRNDDTYHGFPLVVSVENKVGHQIPAKFVSFVDSEWVRQAMFQATKKTPVGEDAFPSIRLELTPSRAYLVVDISPKRAEL